MGDNILCLYVHDGGRGYFRDHKEEINDLLRDDALLFIKEPRLDDDYQAA